MTHSHVTRLIHVRHASLWHDSFICVITHQALTGEQKTRIAQVQSFQHAFVQHNDTRGAAAPHLRHAVCKRQRVLCARYFRTLQTLPSCMLKYILIHVYYLRICAHTHIVRTWYFRTLWSLSSCVCFDVRISSRIYFLLWEYVLTHASCAHGSAAVSRRYHHVDVLLLEHVLMCVFCSSTFSYVCSAVKQYSHWRIMHTRNFYSLQMLQLCVVVRICSHVCVL